MFLHRIGIENFRGIVALDLELDDTTVLIGENASGKTSVLDVLDIVLGHHNEGDEFAFAESDFHIGSVSGDGRRPPIVATLWFRERASGDWDKLHTLKKASWRADDKLRHVVLSIRAEQSSTAATTSWAFLDAAGKPLTAQPPPETLRVVRRLSPFLLVRADRHDAGHPRAPETPAGGTHRGHSEIQLEREISRVYDELIATDGLPPVGELRKGLSAVAKLINGNGGEVFERAEAPGRALEQLVEYPVVLSIAAGPELEARLHGAGARSVALLLLLGAILEARGPASLAADAEMILAIEEPEIHLHPVMLAAVWSLIESLRGQKIVATNSGALVASARLGMLRRLVRRADRTDVYRLGPETLSLNEMRKMTYHVRLKRDDALFARAWLLVEGETEVWLFSGMARLLGVDFASEGIRCVEVAQSGIEPLVKLANDLGIQWHLVGDGDIAGAAFADVATRYLNGGRPEAHITRLNRPDIEHLLWDSGYSYVYHSIARGRSYVTPTAGKKSRKKPDRVIDQAVRNSSKPFLALTVVEQAGEDESPGVPQAIASTIYKTLRLARLAAPASLKRADAD